MSLKAEKYLDPAVIPYYACISFNQRGEKCLGDKTIIKLFYGCKNCLCYKEL